MDEAGSREPFCRGKEAKEKLKTSSAGSLVDAERTSRRPRGGRHRKATEDEQIPNLVKSVCSFR